MPLRYAEEGEDNSTLVNRKKKILWFVQDGVKISWFQCRMSHTTYTIYFSETIHKCISIHKHTFECTSHMCTSFACWAMTSNLAYNAGWFVVERISNVPVLWDEYVAHLFLFPSLNNIFVQEKTLSRGFSNVC
jgi:hypothetical protein